MPGGNIFIMAKILALLSDYLSSSIFCSIILAPILFHVANMLWATVLAFLAGFLILVAKIKFVRKVLAAKVDVNIFNHTLALCLIASGKQEREKRFSALVRCRHNAFPSSYSLAPRQQLWRGSKLKILCQITFRNISNLV